MNDIYDVIVIGGGPSGMMAAGIAASRGAQVLLLEKNSTLGKKLLLSGNGRCNITHAEFDLRALVSAYGDTGAFLFSALHAFGPKQTMAFFEDIGVPLHTEPTGRVFPVSNSAGKVVDALTENLENNFVTISCSCEVKKVLVHDSLVTSVILKNNNEIKTKNLIIATGGLSYPATGSTGDGINWAKKIGLDIVSPNPALVPLKTRESWVKHIQGLALDNVEVTVFQRNKKITSNIGDLLFTHFGVSGPVILNVSKDVIEAKKHGDVTLKINMIADSTIEEFDKKLQSEFKEHSKTYLKNYLTYYVPKRMGDCLLKISKMNGDKVLADITREERAKLCGMLCGLELTVAGDMGYHLAMVTSGGVSVKEIDPKTMRSKKISNLFVVGEALDIDGPTGGYNLQAAWATGYVAGSHIEV